MSLGHLGDHCGHAMIYGVCTCAGHEAFAEIIGSNDRTLVFSRAHDWIAICFVLHDFFFRWVPPKGSFFWGPLVGAPFNLSSALPLPGVGAFSHCHPHGCGLQSGLRRAPTAGGGVPKKPEGVAPIVHQNR